MGNLVYSKAELLREHDYAQPQVEAGHRLHGGFDGEGRYVSPRTAVRWEAVRAWQDALRARGGEILEADTSLLAGAQLPNFEQQKLLLQSGLDQTLWISLTLTGVVEARGRLLAEIEAPDFGKIVSNDVSRMAVGHLNRGLLEAHGLDEGGSPDRGIGGHDAMWFAVRDLVLGRDRYPIPEVPENLGRPDGDRRLVPAIPLEYERTLLFFMNLLMIEIRAELIFAQNQRLFRDPELFTDRRAEAERAAELVERIRQDEEIHVAYLQTVLGELRHCTFVQEPGEPLPGTEVIDPLWDVIVHWQKVERPKLVHEQSRATLQRRILEHPEGERILARFEALSDPPSG
jgi:hypothetical protein